METEVEMGILAPPAYKETETSMKEKRLKGVLGRVGLDGVGDCGMNS